MATQLSRCGCVSLANLFVDTQARSHQPPTPMPSHKQTNTHTHTHTHTQHARSRPLSIPRTLRSPNLPYPPPTRLQSLAFFPGQPFLVRRAAQLLSASPQAPCALALAAVVVSCVSTLAATYALHALTREVHSERIKPNLPSRAGPACPGQSASLTRSPPGPQVFHSNAVADRAAVLFLLSPAAPFFTAAYTEALFACATFTGLLLRARYAQTAPSFRPTWPCTARSRG